MKNELKLPHVGQRITRSVCAVCLCFVVYFLRGCQGIPFYSALAVLQCMQPYRSSSLKMAKKRSVGTFIGAFWGFLVILIQIYVLDGQIIGTFLNYMLISVFTGVVIYSTVIMNCKNNSYFSCVVFLSIVVMHIEDAHPFIFVLNRVVDTLIGVFLALIVNSVHLPRGKNTDVLYVSGIEDVMLTGREPLTDYSKVELNRIIDTGANFTVATIKTPASVMESLADIHLKLPIIAMDGAVLYDLKENRYLKTHPMSYKQAEKIMKILREEDVNFFINVVVEDVLIIYYHHLENEAETQIYKQMRRSPHRNYVRRNLPEGEEVVYFMMIDKTEKIRKIHDHLKTKIRPDEYKMISYESSHYPGYSYIKIYEKNVTRERMTKYLADDMGIHKITTFGSIPGKSDILVEDSNKNTMVKDCLNQLDYHGKNKIQRDKKRRLFMKNKSKGKAVERIYALLDEGSFVEIGQAVTARSTDFQLEKIETPSDGVITGYGLINGYPVYIYSQDAEVLGGSIGEMHARKIVNLYDLAMKTGVAIIGMIDCAGIRLQESTDALHAFGMIYKKQAQASGVILQISAIFGNCGGGLSVFPTLTDFTLMEENGKLFVNAPNAIDGNRKEVLNSASAKFQSSEAGTIDFVGKEDEILAEIKKLTGLFPSNYKDQSKRKECQDNLNRLCGNLDTLDAKEILTQIADQNEFIELKKDYGSDMSIGFIRLDGETVGCVANQEERISAQGAKKAAAFVKLCDAFGVGILTITDVIGYVTAMEQEKELAKAIGTMTGAFVQASVPKVNVITKKAFGSAYVSMNSKAVGADLVYAFKNAKIGMMQAGMAAKIMNPTADADVLKEKAQEYEKLQSDVNAAARRGYVDTIIDPQDTRKYVIGAFEMLYTKRELKITKKHSAF